MDLDRLRAPGGSSLRRLVLYCVLVLGLAGLQPANAAFMGDYAFSNFTVTNSADAMGFAMTPDGGLTLVLTGSNTGSGLPGTTDVTIASLGTGFLSFSYSYSTLDPGGDVAGYVLGSQFIALADQDGQSSSVTVPVMVGQIFGFRIETIDNTFEPGILTLSNFSAPAAQGPGDGTVPEPGTWASLVVASAFFGIGRTWWMKRQVTEGGNK